MRERINLLPGELVKPPQLPFELVFYASLGALTLIVGLLYFSQDREYGRLRAEKDRLSTQANRLSGENSKFKTFTEESARLQGEKQSLLSELNRVQGFLEKRFYFSDVLRELTFIVPDGLWLTDLSLQSQQPGAVLTVSMKGHARLNQSIAAYVLALEKSRWFTEVFLNYSREVGAGGDLLDFEITAQMAVRKERG